MLVRPSAGSRTARPLKVLAAFSLLVITIVLLGFGWATCAIEVAVVGCIVMIDRTASLVDRCDRGAAGKEIVGKALDSSREHGWFALHDVQLDRRDYRPRSGRAGGYLHDRDKEPPRTAARERARLAGAQAGIRRGEVGRAITGIRAVPLLVFSSADLIPALTSVMAS